MFSFWGWLSTKKAEVMAIDDYVMTIRVWDPLEKTDHAKSAVWVIVRVPREDAKLTHEQFIEKHIRPVLPQLTNLNLSTE